MEIHILYSIAQCLRISSILPSPPLQSTFFNEPNVEAVGIGNYTWFSKSILLLNQVSYLVPQKIISVTEKTVDKNLTEPRLGILCLSSKPISSLQWEEYIHSLFTHLVTNKQSVCACPQLLCWSLCSESTSIFSVFIFGTSVFCLPKNSCEPRGDGPHLPTLLCYLYASQHITQHQLESKGDRYQNWSLAP